MIIASVTTCPQRWDHYRRFLRNFQELGLGFPVRTFQTKEAERQPMANNNLNARAALGYAERHLPEDGWLLYLEDDVLMHGTLATALPELVQRGTDERVDAWYLCNRRNGVARQFQTGELTVNELRFPVFGSHALLIPKANIQKMLNSHWGGLADLSMFGAIESGGFRVWQVARPVLVEHIGFVSTYAPERRQIMEVNCAD